MANIEELLPLLDSPESTIRDKAALALSDLGDNNAVAPLFKAIANPANVNHRGTLVYALESLDCSDYFSQLFDLALFGNYEVQCSALAILEEQKMNLTLSALKNAKEKLNIYIAPAHISPEDAKLLCSELDAILNKQSSRL